MVCNLDLSQKLALLKEGKGKIIKTGDVYTLCTLSGDEICCVDALELFTLRTRLSSQQKVSEYNVSDEGLTVFKVDQQATADACSLALSRIAE
tara:strand:+ start:272 stop:550 length:279 start_codon:yes stop_codon:yes gene_type:complete